MQIEVVYALPDAQTLLQVEVTPPCTLLQAIQLCGILIRHPEIDLTRQQVGVFSRVQPLDHLLREGDRIEIYRPLQADPKEVRRQRAKQGRRATPA